MIRHGYVPRGSLGLWACLSILTIVAWLVAVSATAPNAGPRSSTPAPAIGRAPAADSIHWPAGTVRAPFEDLDGVTLVQATATGPDGRDTSGVFVLDTGAGFIALDESLAIALGIKDGPRSGEIDFTRSPLPRLRLANLDIEQAQALVFDADVIRDVTDRPVLGLFGQQPMRDRALWIDYQAKRLALVPAGPASDRASSSIPASRRVVSALLSSAAIAVPFRIVAGGKVLVDVRVVPRRGAPAGWLTFAFDTGATKCALFVSASGLLSRTAKWQPAIHGLETPTLMGKSEASLIRAARVEVRGIGRARPGDDGAPGGEGDGAPDRERGAERDAEPATQNERSETAVAPDVDVLLVDSPLGRELSRVAGETVSGLLGYSFLRRFRVVCDYPHRVLWLDPLADFRDDRPFEHSHAGIQLVREGGLIRVMAVARPSPAQRAGIRSGDEIVTIDRVHAAEASLSDLARLMEGKPGTVFSVTIRRGARETPYRLRRQRLL